MISSTSPFTSSPSSSSLLSSCSSCCLAPSTSWPKRTPPQDQRSSPTWNHAERGRKLQLRPLTELWHVHPCLSSRGWRDQTRRRLGHTGNRFCVRRRITQLSYWKTCSSCPDLPRPGRVLQLCLLVGATRTSRRRQCRCPLGSRANCDPSFDEAALGETLRPLARLAASILTLAKKTHMARSLLLHGVQPMGRRC